MAGQRCGSPGGYQIEERAQTERSSLNHPVRLSGKRRETGRLPGAPRRIRLTEIFLSLQGEGLTTGVPTVFIRFTGCPLRCRYCDTAYAFHGGAYQTLDEVIRAATGYGVSHVTVTGGEPMAQKTACLQLLRELCNLGLHVSLETSGERDLSEVDRRVCKVMDIKTPGSGEQARNRYENIQYLGRRDQVKFVLCDRADYEWSRQLVRERALQDTCTVLFSPVHGELPPADLAEWILQDRLPVRMQLQLHKILWGDEPGR